MERMTDNSRATSSQGPSESGPGGAHNGSRPRKRRRRGSRPAAPAQASGESTAGETPTEGGHSTRSGRRRRGRGKGSASSKNSSQQTQQSRAAGKGSGRGGSKGPHKGSGAGATKGSGRGRIQRPNTSRYRNSSRNSRYADNTMETRDETSAGGLVVSGMAEAVDANGHVDLSRIYVALIGRLDRRGRLLWSMPKGHVENGEHQWATAQREVWEETGIRGEAFEELGVIDYWFVSEGVRIHKTVHHNLLRYVDGILNDEDPEVTEVTWVPMSELIEHLAYADERKLARIAYNRMPDLARKEAAAGRATPR